MTIHRCTVEAGWPGIEETLSRARAGDQVLIAPGRYTVETRLRIPSGIRVTGEQGAVFELVGQDAAIHIVDAEGVELSGIEIRCSTPAVAADAVTDDKDQIVTGLIEVETSRDIEIRDCICHGNGDHHHGIRIRCSDRVRVLSCSITSCRSGIVAQSTIGSRFQDNHCRGNKLSGIRLGRDERSPDQPSEAAITANRCWRNHEFGILFFSSDGLAAHNACWANQAGDEVASLKQPFTTGLPGFIEQQEPPSNLDKVDNTTEAPLSDIALRNELIDARADANLVRALDAEGMAAAEQAADFLGSGCRLCFQRLWTGKPLKAEQPSDVDARPPPPRSGKARVYELETGVRSGRFELERRMANGDKRSEPSDQAAARRRGEGPNLDTDDVRAPLPALAARSGSAQREAGSPG